MNTMTSSNNQINFRDSTAVAKLFLERSELRKIAECEALMEAMVPHTADWPDHAHWQAYFSAVLKDIRDNNWAEAEKTYRELLQAEQLDQFLQGQLFLSLGRCSAQHGQWSEAIKHTNAALTIFQILNEAIEIVKAWKNIAGWYAQGFAVGVYDADVLNYARQACLQAQEILAPLPATHEVAIYQASIHSSLANICLSLRQWQEVETNLRACLAIHQRIDNQFGAAAAYSNLGYFYERLDTNYQTAALEAYHKALALFRQQGNHYYTMMVCANLGHLHHSIQQHQDAINFYCQALDMIDDVRAGLGSETARAGFLSTVADTFANAVLTCIDGDDIDCAFNMCERARARVLLDILAASHVALSEVPVAKPLTLPEIQAALPADALLLTYFTTGVIESITDRFASDSAAERTSFPDATTLIFAISNDDYYWCNTRLSPNLFYPADTQTSIEQHFLDHAMRSELYQCLILPIATMLANKKVVYISPHGPLHLVPFHALIKPDGKLWLQPDGPRFIYTPSPSSLFTGMIQRQQPMTASRLAIGYNGDVAHPLLFAEAEADYVMLATNERAWNGPAAKKAGLFQNSIVYRELHFSCHGRFDSDSPLDSSLFIGTDQTLTGKEIVEKLSLNCDLVVLSACESGLSKIQRGDETYGLIRAFLCAGAKAVIATLWQVDERVTALFSCTFYDKVAQGTTYAEALHAAQLYLQSVTRREVIYGLKKLISSTQMGPNPHRPSDPPLANNTPELVQTAALEQLFNEMRAGDPEEPIFAQPKYWAAFVLVSISQTTGKSPPP